MRIAEIIQTAIHKMEVGGGQRYLRYFLLALAVFYNGVAIRFSCLQNMFTPEGMDAAQLAHNIADGKGYTTQCIRPLSLYLVQSHNQQTEQSSAQMRRVRFCAHQNCFASGHCQSAGVSGRARRTDESVAVSLSG